MLLRFNTTPETMLSSRLLSATGFRFHQAVERLSSGLRVNSAADDASGLSLGTKLQAQTRGWQVAQKNVQDGLSLANVADGALGTLGDAVSRIRELAVRSANGVFTDADRALMQDEVVAVRQNIDQIVKGTQFNGTLLLAGQEFRPPPTVDVSDPALGAIAASARGTDDTETGS